jgi:hypothetical protein
MCYFDHSGQVDPDDFIETRGTPDPTKATIHGRSIRSGCQKILLKNNAVSKFVLC